MIQGPMALKNTITLFLCRFATFLSRAHGVQSWKISQRTSYFLFFEKEERCLCREYAWTLLLERGPYPER